MAATKIKTEDFFPLGEAEMKELRKQSTERSLKKGDFIWRAGDEPGAVWMALDGRANMVIEGAEGGASLVHFCTKAQVFCPAAAISGRPYPCSAVAAADMTVVSIPRSSFMSLFKRLPEFARKLLTQMAPQVCESHCSQARSASPVKDRLAAVLGNLNRRYQGQNLPFTRQELANMCGTTVETTIRTLSEWEKDGVIHSQRGSIQVRQPETLEAVLA